MVKRDTWSRQGAEPRASPIGEPQRGCPGIAGKVGSGPETLNSPYVSAHAVGTAAGSQGPLDVARRGRVEAAKHGGCDTTGDPRVSHAGAHSDRPGEHGHPGCGITHVGVGIQVRGSGRAGQLHTCDHFDGETDVGNPEVGSVRTETHNQVYFSASTFGKCSLPCVGTDAHVLEDVSIHQESTGAECSFHPAWGYDGVVASRILEPGNCNDQRSLDKGRQPQQCEEVHRAVPLSDGIGIADQDVRCLIEEPRSHVLRASSMPLDIHRYRWQESFWAQEELRYWLEHDPWYYDECRECTLLGADHKVRESRRPTALPLERVTSNRIVLENFYSLSIQPDEELRDAWSWIRTDRLMTYIPTQPVTKVRVSRALGSEVPMLIDTGVICHRAALHAITSKLFKVPKKDVMARLIADCRPINELLPPPGDMGLPELHKAIEGLMECEWAVQFDGKSYFYQFELRGGAERCFPVCVGAGRGKFDKYCLNVLPMGFKYAPRIAQLTSNNIVNNVRAATGCYGFAWVDNFVFGARSQEEIGAVVRSFQDVCKCVNLEYKIITEPGTTLDVLGTRIDLGTKEIRPNDSLRRSILDKAGKLGIRSSIRQAVSLTGSIMWAMYGPLRSSLALIPRTMSWVSDLGTRVMSGQGWDSILTPEDEGIVATMKALASSVGNSVRYYVPDTIPGRSVWTDASNVGGGIVADDDCITRGWEIAWSAADVHLRESSIFIRELATACEAIHSLADKEGVTIVTDNSAVHRALVKGHSSSLRANGILNRLVRGRLHTQSLWVAWCPSLAQRADGLSRGIATTAAEMPFVIRPVQARWKGSTEAYI